MTGLIKFFYLTPRDLDTQYLDVDKIAELMKPATTNENNLPHEFAEYVSKLLTDNNNSKPHAAKEKL